MTDRINGVFVTLEDDIRIDDAEHLLNAIRMVKGVVDVTPNVTDFNDHMAKVTAKIELGDKIMKVLREPY
jgi:hypothetical protein